MCPRLTYLHIGSICRTLPSTENCKDVRAGNDSIFAVILAYLEKESPQIHQCTIFP